MYYSKFEILWISSCRILTKWTMDSRVGKITHLPSMNLQVNFNSECIAIGESSMMELENEQMHRDVQISRMNQHIARMSKLMKEI